MNKNRIKNILFLVFAILLFSFALVLFCASKTDDAGFDYEYSNGRYVYVSGYKFDSNHLIGMVSGLLLIGYAIYILFKDIKNEKVNQLVKPIVFGVIFVIFSFYSGSVFFEKMIEDDAKFKDVQSSLYSFIAFGVLTAYYIFDYFCKKKENN